MGKNEATSQTYRRDGVGVTSPVLSDGISHFTPGVSQHTTATTFNDADRLGSFSTQTNSSQSKTATQTFDAFGMLVSSTGSPAGPFGFAGSSGYQTDASGLQLLGHRYYDSSTGRFLTKDGLKSGRNWYAYCENNPARSVDPSGDISYNAVVRIIFGLINALQWYNSCRPVSVYETRTTGGPRYEKPAPEIPERPELPDAPGPDPTPTNPNPPTEGEEAVKEALKEGLEKEMEDAAEEGTEAAETVAEISVAEDILIVAVIVE